MTGISRPWRATPPCGEHRLHALIDEALVRGVLVDDDDGIARLRQDVGLVQLRARGAERPVEQGLGDRRGVGARIGTWCGKRLERRLHRFGERRTTIEAARRPDRPARGRSNGTTLGFISSSVAAPPPAEARWPAAVQRGRERVDDERAHAGRVAEAHLCFRRVHVNVDLGGGSATNSASSGWRPRGMRSP